jgi:CRP-like cAMP-binding protein
MVNTRLIQSISLFKGLSDNQCDQLASIAIEKSFGKKEDILLEGDQCDGFHAIVSGQVMIYKLSPDGREQILHMLSGGEVFGEVPVFEGTNFPANATAIERTKTLFFPRDKFIGLVKKDPTLSLKMLAELSRRLREFASMIETLSLREVPGRLAAYLLDLKSQQTESDTIILDIPKHQLASLLGTIPETLSRIFTKMSKKGLICSTGSKTLQILDEDGLTDLANGNERL